MGRVTTFTPEIAERICERLSAGEPLAVICRDEAMPGYRTVYDWKDANPDFAANIARAREDGFDAIAAECLLIADDDSGDAVEEGLEGQAHGGSLKRSRGSESVQRDRLRVETRLKLLAKWDPKRYGEKVALTGGGEGDAPIKSELSVKFV